MTDLALSSSGKTLRLYEKMQTAVAACYSVDECKAIADQAAAIAAYHKQIKDDVSMRQFLELNHARSPARRAGYVVPRQRVRHADERNGFALNREESLESCAP
jgi:hypothetical protein